MKDEIFNLLDKLGIEYRLVSHPAVFTVAESAAHIEDNFPVKNLLLQDAQSGKKVLVIMAGEHKLDAKALARKLGHKKLQFAKSEILKETLGVEPGAVSLFGLLHPGAGDVEIVVDARLVRQASEVGFHPNDNTETIFIPSTAIEQILQALRREHKIIDLSD